MTRTTINQKETSRYRPIGELQYQCIFCTTVDPSETKEGKIYSDLCRSLLITFKKINKYIYVMYVYDCDDILTTETKNISYKDIFHMINNRLKKTRNKHRIPLYGQLSIDIFENGNDNHGYQLPVGPPK